MYLYLSKVLPLLVYPLGVTLICSLLALIFLWRRRTRASALFLGLGLVVLWVASTPLAATALYGSLERQHPPVAMALIPERGCIVLLGGAVSDAVPPRVDIELSGAVDRVLLASRLYKSGKARKVIVAAGNLPWLDWSKSEAELIRGLLVEWGVEASDIVLDGSSRNTYENAVNARPLLERSGCEQPLLVTSAFHMGRAVATFEKQGTEVFPVPSDVHIVGGQGVTVFDFLPSAEALVTTTLAIKEWLGRRVYEFRDWN
jgi:uncharacterized SAM-binding protein YcdF (DUF218 family)